MTSNMQLWESVCETDPGITKEVNQRGGFTSIDAYSQIKRATEVWGPVGTGWGWRILEEKAVEGLYIITIDFQYQGQSFPVVASSSLTMGTGDKKRPDEDAPKKALTDAITKALSYLGFNADVFLGMFEDDNYVNGMRYKKSLEDFEDLIQLIKDSIETEDYTPGAIAWFQQSEATKTHLWVAPTKGGPFTTAERKVMQSQEWRLAAETQGK